MQQQLNDNPEPKYKKGDLIILNSGRRGRIISEPKWNSWCSEIVHNGCMNTITI